MRYWAPDQICTRQLQARFVCNFIIFKWWRNELRARFVSWASGRSSPSSSRSSSEEMSSGPDLYHEHQQDHRHHHHHQHHHHRHHHHKHHQSQFVNRHSSSSSSPSSSISMFPGLRVFPKRIRELIVLNLSLGIGSSPIWHKPSKCLCNC